MCLKAMAKGPFPARLSSRQNEHIASFAKMTMTWLLGLMVAYKWASVVGEPTLLGMGKSGGAAGSLKGASFEFSKGDAGLPSKVHGKGLDVDVDVLQLVTAGGVLKFLNDSLEFRQGTSSYSLARDKDGRISVGDGKETLLSFGGAYNGTESFSLNVAGPVEAPNIAALDELMRGLQARVEETAEASLEGNRTYVVVSGEIAAQQDALQALKDTWEGVEGARLLNDTRVNHVLLGLEDSVGVHSQKMEALNATALVLGEALVTQGARVESINATHMALAALVGAEVADRAVFVHNVSTFLAAHNATTSALRKDVTGNGGPS